MEAAEVEIRRLLLKFFNGKETHVEEWLNSPNKEFKGKTPSKLILKGQEDQVLAYVQGALWQNGHGEYDDQYAVDEIVRLLSAFFKDDQSKVKAWLNSENPMFGNTVPADLINRGRAEKVLKWIKAALSENGNGQY